MTYGQKFEDDMNNRFSKRDTGDNERAKHLFASIGSHGANKKRLAQLCATWDYVMHTLEWNETLTEIVTGYQASIDTHYHNDYKAVATIEELDKRLAMRRSAAYKQDIGINQDTTR